jgi:hypothetical protein
LKQYKADVEKLLELIKSDQEIINLRTSIKNTTKSQIDNGVATANDLIREINAEEQAKQNKIIHEVQLLITQYNYLSVSGN